MIAMQPTIITKKNKKHSDEEMNEKCVRKKQQKLLINESQGLVMRATTGMIVEQVIRHLYPIQCIIETIPKRQYR